MAVFANKRWEKGGMSSLPVLFTLPTHAGTSKGDPAAAIPREPLTPYPM